MVRADFSGSWRGRACTVSYALYMDGRWLAYAGDKDGHIPNDTTLSYMSMEGICGSDDFSASGLSLYWQWNHNPVDQAWSLTDRPGFLRLKTSRVVDNLFVAPNTLTQRMVGPKCMGTVSLSGGG